ncbi:hypothetical protein P7C71_g2365, partial [Lecanoromycetidae sp. Uapishka_2]
MPEYEKLTVIKLREELVKRGLPKTGLKSALVQRLVDSDATSGAATSTPSVTAVGQQPEEESNNGLITNDAPVQDDPQGDVKGGEEAPTSINAQRPSAAGTQVKEGTILSDEDKGPTQATEGKPLEIRTEGEVKSKVHPEAHNETLVMAAPLEHGAGDQDAQDEALPGNLTQAASPKDASSEPQLPTPSQTQLEPTQAQEGLSRISTQTSLTGDEIIEDSRKRKRRSHSPPPSSIETLKRLKSGDSAPHVELPEDATTKEATTEDAPRIMPFLDGPSNQGAETQSIDHSKAESERKGMDTPPPSDPANKEKATPTPNGTTKNDEADEQEAAISTESSIKSLPSDTRFKNLFTAPSKPDSSVQQPPYTDSEDRVVTPALHPATTALYIRELMRPLKPEAVRDHLIALATPPEIPIDSNIVIEFHLDSIRTHCLAVFANVSAASRVRSSLHDRIWPNERDRRPLFVDFVPEEKVKKWIDVEQSAPNGRGQPNKKWEVVYEDEDGEIKAYLQEVGSNQNVLERAAAKSAQLAGGGQGVQGAPSGPRVRESETRAPRPEAETGKGFQALDDLFKSTVAKPKLYYQPVAKTEADRRLDLLAAARGGGRSDEMRRYTFEDDIIVDKSPEFGHRGRGGYGGRAGGFAGGHRGRGRGGSAAFRGDGYRGGDTYRDRR